MTLLSVCCFAVAVSGCAAAHRLFGGADPEAEANRLQQVQLKAMRFADEYVGRVLEPARHFQREAVDPSDRLEAQSWSLSQATAAYTIASGPNPITNTLDLVVLATLSRMVMEDTWVRERYGERAIPLGDAHRKLESEAWSLVASALTASQIQQLHEVIDTWRADNPHVRAVTYIHFRDFVQALGPPSATGSTGHGGLFSLLRIDPLNGLDPAVRELAQTRQLAERMIYYAQRVPTLLDMEVARLTYELAATPETRAILQDASRTSLALEAAGKVATQLPDIIAREREEAIDQLMRELTAQERRVSVLAGELRGMLEAGKGTSDSVQSTLQAADQLVARFAKRNRSSTAGSAQREPFDIANYTRAAREIGSSAEELRLLAAQLDASVPRLGALAKQSVREAQGLIDYALTRLVVLTLIQAAIVLSATLVFRRLIRR